MDAGSIVNYSVVASEKFISNVSQGLMIRANKFFFLMGDVTCSTQPHDVGGRREMCLVGAKSRTQVTSGRLKFSAIILDVDGREARWKMRPLRGEAQFEC